MPINSELLLLLKPVLLLMMLLFMDQSTVIERLPSVADQRPQPLPCWLLLAVVVRGGGGREEGAVTSAELLHTQTPHYNHRK